MSTNTSAPTLQSSIQQPLFKDEKKFILKKCWPNSFVAGTADQQVADLAAYFHHYEVVCQNRSVNETGFLQHCHIIKAFEIITTSKFSQAEATLKQSIVRPPHLFSQTSDDSELVHQLIDLTGQALLLLDIGHWSGDEDLQTFLRSKSFSPSAQADNYRIPQVFNLRNLDKIGGIKIRWTDILSEHLALEKEDTQVAIFHHGRVLDMLEESQLYPKGIVEEVRNTFAILHPRFDRSSQKWFDNQTSRPRGRTAGSSAILDGSFAKTMLKAPERNIRAYNFFRDRLICVKETYDAHEPETFMQSCRDYRKPARRWGFIIAGLLFVFGMVQVIEGAIQVYKSYHPA
ncbi:hypothetical protein H2202_010721 [Exophiala xenobiotica]|nr:hypothetical protein H2202_010721 [Exophiala xenobiotica]KAK5233530.1 hypothetical protein LTR47_005623 [Exophiala xenobiotica]KAK5244322.1 hypothetical protein LTS06_010085 [Exophiala xenobiotica]KAK5259280.1 hypothetical protein LTR40_006279 [Exophiala xenobiotica]KAK5317172.1 hypothetical protein LTR93_008947 [Exophiala xenobiotica]